MAAGSIKHYCISLSGMYCKACHELCGGAFSAISGHEVEYVELVADAKSSVWKAGLSGRGLGMGVLKLLAQFLLAHCK